MVNDSADVTSSGRSFQVCGLAVGKARLPTVWQMLSLTFVGSQRHCATGRGDHPAVRSKLLGPNRKGPTTKCASSVVWHSQVMSTGKAQVLTRGDVGDQNTAVDNIIWYSRRLRACIKRCHIHYAHWTAT